MAIPAVVCGDSCPVALATAIFWRRTARSFTASACPFRVLACLAEGLGIRATARVFEMDPNTVLQWLVEAAEQLQAFTSYFLCDMHVTQLPLDELYAVLRGIKEGEISEANALKRLEPSRPWVWTAIDPVSKLGLRSPRRPLKIIGGISNSHFLSEL